jgi:hypothetical protein
MTPSAMTAAGAAAPAKRRSPGPPSRTPPRPQGAPVRPRRVSGPATGRAAAPVPSRAPSIGVGPRLVVFVRSLPDHSWLDRVVRGRVWIGLLGVLLAGIVATQVEVLRLNADMGRALAQSSTLSVRNQALRTSVAELSDDARIERLAAGMGMVFPVPTGLTFVPAGANVAHAAQSIHRPDPTQFASQLPSAGSAGG